MSPRVRMLAVAGLVAVLALAGGLLLLGRGGSPSAAVKRIKPLHPHRHDARVRVAHKRVKRIAPKSVERVSRPAVIDGVPAALALALRAHDVVVVSLYAPSSSVDRLAKAEAQQGAAIAGAGYVALDVSDEKIAAPLTSLLTSGASAADRVLDDPAVLVFRSPRTLFVRLSGWTDRDTVAQAAANAAQQ